MNCGGRGHTKPKNLFTFCTTRPISSTENRASKNAKKKDRTGVYLVSAGVEMRQEIRVDEQLHLRRANE